MSATQARPYRQRSVVVEARQVPERDDYTTNEAFEEMLFDIAAWCGPATDVILEGNDCEESYIVLPGAVGLHVQTGDYVVRDSEGRFYPVRARAFTDKFEEIIDAEEPVFTDEELAALTTRFSFHKYEDDALAPVVIERTKQEEDVWAIRWMGRCLNDAGFWEYEPLPSSRDDSFLARTRFSREAALRRVAVLPDPRDVRSF